MELAVTTLELCFLMQLQDKNQNSSFLHTINREAIQSRTGAHLIELEYILSIHVFHMINFMLHFQEL